MTQMTYIIAGGGGKVRGAARHTASVELINIAGSICSNDKLDYSEHGTNDGEHHERGDLQRSQLQRLH